MTPARAQGPSDARAVHLNGFEMFYEERGDGEPLVLLHGFGGCAENWEPFLDRLAAHHRLIVPELRGHGRSTDPGGTFSHRRAAGDVLALLDTLGIGRFDAMGISTGGMTLLHVATREPERVDAMVLIGTTPYFPDQARSIMRRMTFESLEPGLLEMLRACATRGEPQFRRLVEEFLGFEDSYDDVNFSPPLLSTIEARTLVVHGDRDAFFPVEMPVEMYRAIPEAELWIIPGGGHVPIYDPAVPFVPTVLRFLGDGAEARTGE